MTSAVTTHKGVRFDTQNINVANRHSEYRDERFYSTVISARAKKVLFFSTPTNESSSVFLGPHKDLLSKRYKNVQHQAEISPTATRRVRHY
jgi:poly-D-alanine transfer protein DltD